TSHMPSVAPAQPRALLLHSPFYRSDDAGDRHSFPTRRSSDLSIIFTVHNTFAPLYPGRFYLTGFFRAEKSPLISLEIPAVRTERSEEHTSELQSRENLVCRLLLEKKKQQHLLLHPHQLPAHLA